MLVGHNISFDTNILRVELLRRIYAKHEHFRKYKHYLLHLATFKNVFCTMKSSVDVCKLPYICKSGKIGKAYKNPKLVELHEILFQNTPNDLHNSMIDVLVTLRCFVKLQYDADISTNCRIFKRCVSAMKMF